MAPTTNFRKADGRLIDDRESTQRNRFATDDGDASKETGHNAARLHLNDSAGSIVGLLHRQAGSLCGPARRLSRSVPLTVTSPPI